MVRIYSLNIQRPKFATIAGDRLNPGYRQDSSTPKKGPRPGVLRRPAPSFHSHISARQRSRKVIYPCPAARDEQNTACEENVDCHRPTSEGPQYAPLVWKSDTGCYRREYGFISLQGKCWKGLITLTATFAHKFNAIEDENCEMGEIMSHFMFVFACLPVIH